MFLIPCGGRKATILPVGDYSGIERANLFVLAVRRDGNNRGVIGRVGRLAFDRMGRWTIGVFGILFWIRIGCLVLFD